MPRTVRIRYPEGHERAGAEYDIEGGASVARQAHPEAEITVFADDGTPYSPEAARRRPAVDVIEPEHPAPAAERS